VGDGGGLGSIAQKLAKAMGLQITAVYRGEKKKK
jgi:D-arabinose 1-dehydrogenase-like Zn-dependent alcohol dehydrogenase